MKTGRHVFTDALQAKYGTSIRLPQLSSVEFEWFAEFERINEIVNRDELAHENLHYGV